MDSDKRAQIQAHAEQIAELFTQRLTQRTSRPSKG